jgi:hypothetical protein
MEVERAGTARPAGLGHSVTLFPPPANERGGSSRPSRATARAVVIALDPEVRDGWARALEAMGMEVARCVGPTVSCALLRGEERCPLLDGASLALYHEAILSEAFVRRLRAANAPAMAVATRDRHRTDGDHEPALSHVIAPPGG